MKGWHNTDAMCTEACTCKVWCTEACTCKVWCTEACTCKVWCTEACTCKVWCTETCTCKVWCTEACTCKVWCTKACTCKVWSSSIQQLNQVDTLGKLQGKLSYLHSKLHYGSQSAKLNKSSNKSGVFEQILVDHIPG